MPNTQIFSKALAGAGSTGNNTHTGVQIGPQDALYVDFVVEAVGGTPTVTYKIQGSMDSTNGVTGNWVDLCGMGSTATTVAAGNLPAVTATGHNFHVVLFGGALRDSEMIPFKWYRLVTTANTNVTYSSDAYTLTN